jgi:hypothetical protein
VSLIELIRENAARSIKRFVFLAVTQEYCTLRDPAMFLFSPGASIGAVSL